MSNAFESFSKIHPFLLTWCIFFSGGIGFVAFQAVRNRKTISAADLRETFLPFDPIRSASVRADLIIYFFRKFTDSLFAVPGLLFLTLIASQTQSSMISLFGLSPQYNATQLSAFFCTLIIVLSVELSEYVVHYFEHKVPFLWELHKVHHSADHMTPLTTKREHSLLHLAGGLTGGLIRGVPAGIIMYLYNLNLSETFFMSVVANRILLVWTLDPLKHSHVPIGLGWFDNIFISPHMHQIHHSKTQAHWDRNFGTNLSIFDWLFGTAYRPQRGEKAVFGIAGYSDASLQKFNTLHGTFINPMQRSYKRLLKCILEGVGTKLKLERRKVA